MDETDVAMIVPDAGGETLLHHAAFHGKVCVVIRTSASLVRLCAGSNLGVAT